MSHVPQYDGNRSGRGWSTQLWQNCPWQGIGDNPGLGFRYFTDFVGDNAGDLVITATAGSGTAAAANAHYGHMVLTTAAATDTHGVNVAVGGVTGACVTPSAATTIWWEGLFKFVPSTGTVGTFHAGLSTQVTNAIPVQTSTSNALATSIDRVGFVAGFAADGSQTANGLRFHYLRSGASAYLSSANLTVKGSTATITTGEWIKLGFKYEGLTTITPYINSVAQTPIVYTSAGSNPVMPNAVMNMTLSAMAKGGTGAATLTCDWLRFACRDDSTGIVTVA